MTSTPLGSPISAATVGGGAPAPAAEPATRQAAKSFVWTALESVSVSGLLFIVVILMARHLTPEQFGIVAIALSVVQPATAIVESLFYEAIIHTRDLTDRHVDTAFFVTFGLGVGCAGAAWGAGALLAWLFATPELLPLTGVLGLTLLGSGLVAVPVACLRRDLNFKSLAIRSIVGRGAGAGIGLAAVFVGIGEWALIVQQLATAVLGLTVIVGSLPRFPRLRFSRQEFRELWRYGLPSVTTTLAFHLDVRMYSLLVGYLYGTNVLGYLNLAYRLIDGIRDMLHYSAYHLALPLLSRRRGDDAALFRGFLRLGRMVASVTLPLFATAGVFAPELIRFAVGPNWLPSVLMMRAVCGAACLYFLIDAAPIVFGTLRRPQMSMVINLCGMAVGLLLIAVVPRFDDAVPGYVWLTRYAVIAGLTYLGLNRVGLGLRALGVMVWPVLVSAILTIAVTVMLREQLLDLPPIVTILIGAVVSAVMSVGLGFLIMRSTVRDVGQFLLSVSRRGR